MNREIAIKRSKELVEQMTLEEMASQLRFDAPGINRLGIPEYNWWNEGLHGVARGGTATVFPQAIGLAATFDDELLYEVGKAISLETRGKYNEAIKYGDRDIYKGLTLWSPNVNIFRDPRWGRGHETYGEDPYLTGRLGVSFIKGLQGEGQYLMTAACAKHFAVHSGPEALRHSFNAEATLKDLWETYLPAFEDCVIEGQVEAVMGAYNRTNGEPCCAHDMLMNEVLRGKWNFQGHYVSDCWAIRDFHEHHMITVTSEESVKLALEMGCDLNCGCTYQRILVSYNQGLLSEKIIKQSVIRLFTTRFLLGMFDETEYNHIPYEVVECKEHLALASKAASESIVLLKNNGILPINRETIKTIGVIGPNANSQKALMGNYYGTSSRYVTVLEGIQEVVGEDTRILYSEGCHLFLERPDKLSKAYNRLSEAKTVANHSDLVVLCLGLDETLEGEEGDTGNSDASGDKEDLHFPATQRKLLETIVETGVPFILCVMTGSAMDLCYSSQHAGAILQTWYPGGRGGKDVAEILFGLKSPSGKLPITLYRDLDGMPEFTDYTMKGRTYRYLEKDPLYPFGYGLTYGNSFVESATVDENINYQIASKNGMQICVHVKNDSNIDVEEVLQVYVKVIESENEVRNTKLCAFKRITIKAKESIKIKMELPAKAFCTINEMGEKIFDGSAAFVYVGFGQPDHITEMLRGNSSYKIVI